MATRESLRQRIRARTGDVSGDRYTTLDINEAINEARKDITRASLNFEKLVTVTTFAGQEGYDLPADFIFARAVYLNQKWLLNPVVLDSAQVVNKPQGSPTNYYIWGSKIYFFPIPDGSNSVSLWYYSYPAALNGDNDSLDPKEKENLIINYVLAMVYEMDGEEQRALYYRNLYEAGLAEYKTYFEKYRHSGPLQMDTSRAEMLETGEMRIFTH